MAVRTMKIRAYFKTSPLLLASTTLFLMASKNGMSSAIIMKGVR